MGNNISVRWHDEKGYYQNGFIEIEEVTDPEIALFSDYKMTVYDNDFGAVKYISYYSIEALKNIQEEIANSNYNISWLLEM